VRRRYVLVSLLIVLLLGSCARATEGVRVTLGQESSLRVGQSVTINEEELEIRFVEVVEDSRCPRDVTCVWEGKVSCIVEITHRESLHRVVLIQPGLTSQPSREPFGEYQMSFHGEPYPEADKEIPGDDYRLLLRVVK